MRFMLVAVSFFWVATSASAEVRTLKIYHLHTHEKAEIAYKKDGRYLPEGLKQLDYILRDWREDKPAKMDPRLFDLLWAVYQKTGSNEYINVVCGYRAPETNAMLRSRTRGVAQQSQHMQGKAIDFFIPGVPLEKLREIGLKMEVGGVGYYPTSGSPFVHMDVGSPRHWPRMSRRQLLALFPGGKTLYIPADGKPMPRYDEALADYKARNGAAPDVQLASASQKHRGFFAFLFGGGADEQEDEQDIKVASAKPAPSRQIAKPAATRAVLPGVEMATVPDESPAPAEDKPEAIVAALPAREVPLPLAAPRPEADVGPASAESTDDAGTEPQLAFNAPLPSHRPDYTPLVQTASTDATRRAPQSTVFATPPHELRALLDSPVHPSNRPDDNGADPAPPATLAAFSVELPSPRPQGGAATFAMLPQQRPQYEPDARSMVQPAVFRPDDTSGKGDRVASANSGASPRLAILQRPDGMSVTASISSGVRTKGKVSRPAPGEPAPERRSYQVPIHQEVVHWAVQQRSASPAIASSTAHSLAYNIVHSSPRMVYTAGFQQSDKAQTADRFTGNAVKFLPVARFDTDRAF